MKVLQLVNHTYTKVEKHCQMNILVEYLKTEFSFDFSV